MDDGVRNLKNDDSHRQKKELKNNSENIYKFNQIQKEKNDIKIENTYSINEKENGKSLIYNDASIQSDIFNYSKQNIISDKNNNMINKNFSENQVTDAYIDVINDQGRRNEENEENKRDEEDGKNEENGKNDNSNKDKTKKNYLNYDKKKNKKVTNISHIVQYNRYKPVRIDLFKKKITNPYVKKNKNQYINCNFRYYVLEKGYLMQNTIGENIKWEKIEKVDYIIFDNTSLSCPICLENNIISPRITKCRHIFCFFCILKYFVEEEKKSWKRCPICFEIINENELRTVKFHYVKNYNINDRISLCLLYTENNKINLKSDKLYFNNNFEITNKNFVKNSKVIDYKYFVNIDYMNKNLANISEEHSDKIIKLNLNLGVQFFKLFYIYNPLSIWIKDLSIFNFILTNKNMKSFVSDEAVIKKAISNIKLKMSDYLNIPVEKLNPELSIDENSFDFFYLYDNLAHNVYDSIEQIKKEMELEMELLEVKKMTKNQKNYIDSEQNNSIDSMNLKELSKIYFYQCIEGQYIYLDPFILKLLFYEYNYNINELPTFLYNKKITYIDSFELDEKMRKKYCILSHLPLGVNVLFVSLNLDDVLSERTKNHFSKEILIRESKHNKILTKKKKEEKHFKLLAEEEIERKEKDYWNLSNNKINIVNYSENTRPNISKFYNSSKLEKYLYGELENDTLLKYDDTIIEKEIIKINSKETNYNIENSEDIHVKGKNKEKKKKDKHTDENNLIKYKEKKVNNKSDELKNIKNENNQIPKRSFLEIAKKKCDVNMNKLQIVKKKEENLSIGNGSVNINLLDLINNKISQKKKKKK